MPCSSCVAVLVTGYSCAVSFLYAAPGFVFPFFLLDRVEVSTRALMTVVDYDAVREASATSFASKVVEVRAC